METLTSSTATDVWLFIVLTNLGYMLPMIVAWMRRLYDLVAALAIVIVASTAHHVCADAGVCSEEVNHIFGVLDSITAYNAIAITLMFVANYDLIKVKANDLPQEELDIYVTTPTEGSTPQYVVVQRTPDKKENQGKIDTKDDETLAQEKAAAYSTSSIESASSRYVLVKHTYADIATLIYYAVIIFSVLGYRGTITEALIIFGYGVLAVGLSFLLYWRMKSKTLKQRFHGWFMLAALVTGIIGISIYAAEDTIGRSFHAVWHLTGALTCLFLIWGASRHLKIDAMPCCTGVFAQPRGKSKTQRAR